ncbi:MAG TPA: DUF1289 domain-containing protein [Stellaceae bacterium]|jgi:predicted Fe-S protein YdhL (DUF1289 family)|nr:DUF1289 domain-containing protein [Stellaceae bacterium]
MTLAPIAEGMLPSPCVGICRLDDTTGWCLGCARDANELGRWRDLSPAQQAAVWADLPRRKAILGLGFRLLPWSGGALSAALVDLAGEPNTGWSIGVYGAVAEFATRNGTPPEIEVGDEQVILRTSGGALRLRPPAGTRMFELIGAAGKVERRVLALHRSRVREVPAAGVTELGADDDAIEPAHRNVRLFDLGVSRSIIRFCVRTGDPALIAALRQADGHDPFDPALRLAPALLANSPDRVVTSPIGRIEVFRPILNSDREGPHTHLLPALLACRQEQEPGIALPEGYQAGVSVFPTQ